MNLPELKESRDLKAKLLTNKPDQHREYHDSKPNRLSREVQHFDKNIHSDSGPADVRYDENGNISEVNYIVNGKLHRVDGPAKVSYFPKKNRAGKSIIQREMYFVNGEPHNTKGPAVKIFDESGKLIKARYCLNGDTFRNKNEWLQKLSTLNNRTPLKESHDPNSTPEPFRTLLMQLEEIKVEQMTKLSKVKFDASKHVFGYDLCEKIYKLHVDGKLDFTQPPTSQISSFLSKNISRLYNNFEKIKTIAFINSLLSQFSREKGSVDPLWNQMLNEFKNVKMIKEEYDVFSKFVNEKFTLFMNNLVGK